MDILITNDDGIQAAGIAALHRAASALPDANVWIVAPAVEQSQCGHRVTTHEPIAVDRVSDSRFAVHGTPADCVRVALFGLGLKPDWVFSGINHGGNMGQDLVISGTVAAAREAAYHGLRAAALSHYVIRDLPFDWDRVTRWSTEILIWLLQVKREHAAGEWWNFNLPHLPPGEVPLPGLQVCQPARSPLPVAFAAHVPEKAEAPSTMDASSRQWFRYAGTYAHRPQDPESDVQACFSGAVAVSRLSV